MGYEPFKDEIDLKNFFKKCGYEPAHDLDYETKNAEWLKIKHGVIGGSEAGIVHGVSPFVSRAKLAADKIADFELESGIDAAKQYIFDLGHQFEPVALSYYQRVTGNETFTSRCMYQHDTKDFMIADLDGLCITNEGELRICEIKFTNPRAAKEWKSGEHGKDGYCAVPTYFAQCQHVMAVLGNNIRELFPDPETPVTQVMIPRGIFTSIFFRLFSLAPCTVSQPAGTRRSDGTGIRFRPLR